MKKLFKAVAAMLMSAMVAASLAGCGSSEGGEGKKLTEINIWTGDSHSKNTMKELVDKFNKERGEKLGVKVVYTVKEGNYNQTIDMAVASEQAPDMFTCFSTQKYAEGGTVIAIDDIKGGKEYLDSVLDEEAKDNFITTYDRKCYKVPFYVNTFGVIYNKDMFKAHGLVDENGEAKPPETYEEFVQYAKELTNTENSEYGIILPFKDSGTASYFINLTFASTGSKGYDPITGKYDYTVLAPAYDTLAKMKENGSLYPGAESLDNDMARALFAEGKIGMIFGGSFDVAVLTSQFPAKCDWSVAPLPIENKDEAYMQRMANDGGLVINKKTVEKIGDEKVLEIFKWFHSDEVLSELFKQGMAIPYDREIIDSVQPNEGIHEAWSKFGQMRKISTTYPREMPTDLEGTPSLSDIFKTNILPGNGNTVELLGDLSERSNNGIEKKFSVNSNLKREDYLKDEYDVRR